jgi:hypothetical protein
MSNLGSGQADSALTPGIDERRGNRSSAGDLDFIKNPHFILLRTTLQGAVSRGESLTAPMDYAQSQPETESALETTKVGRALWNP